MPSLISCLAPSRAVLRMLPVAALLSLSVGSGCKKKEKKTAAKDAPVAKKAEEKKMEKRAAPAAAGAGWLGLVSLMPEGSTNVVGLHLDALRKSPFWKDVEGQMVKDQQGKKILSVMKQCKLSFDDISRVAVCDGADGFGSGSFVLSGKDVGNTTKIKCVLEAVKTQAQADAKAKGEKLTGEVYKSSKKEGRDIYTVDSSKLGLENRPGVPQGNVHLLVVDAGRIVVAQDKQLDAVMKRLAPKAAPLSSSFAPLQKHLNPSGSVIVVGVPDQEMKKMMSSNGVNTVHNYRLSLDLTKGLGLSADLEMGKKEQAEKTAKMFSAKINEQKPMLAFLSLPPTLLDSLKIVAQGPTVHASLQLTTKEVGALRSVLEKRAAGAAGAP